MTCLANYICTSFFFGDSVFDVCYLNVVFVIFDLCFLFVIIIVLIICSLLILSVLILQEQMNEVIDAMFEKIAEKDEYIIKQGDDGDNFYVIQE